jgi:hypothetical protein
MAVVIDWSRAGTIATTSLGARPTESIYWSTACETVAWTTVLAIRAAYRALVRRRIAERAA